MKNTKKTTTQMVDTPQSKYFSRLSDILDKHFPKFECKERVQAIMFLADCEMMLSTLIEDNWDEFLHKYWHEDCIGCEGGHSSFWRTILISPQWKLWQKEQRRRFKLMVEKKLPKDITVYDMGEVEELGQISEGHFQDFIKFIQSK